MKDEIFYEPVGEANYQHTITAFEREVDRLKGELLPAASLSPIERDKQHQIWLQLDRVAQHLAKIRDKAIDTIHLS